MALIRREEPTLPPLDAPKQAQTHTILGPESVFEGKLTFQGAVRIDGKFKGSIFTEDTLVVGEKATVEAGRNTCRNVDSKRHRSRKHLREKVLELQGPAIVWRRRDAKFDNPKGVIFQGSCRMENLGPAKENSGSHQARADRDGVTTRINLKTTSSRQTTSSSNKRRRQHLIFET